MKEEIEVIGQYKPYSPSQSRFYIESCTVFGQKRTAPRMDYTKTQLARIINPIWSQIMFNRDKKVKLTVTIETVEEKTSEDQKLF